MIEAEMFAVMLFAISTVALSQFALYYWRAMLSGVASHAVSDQVYAAARVQNGRLEATDFATLVGLHDLTPELYANRNGLATVRLYYWVLGLVEKIAGSHLQAVTGWSGRERILCARYAAVQIDRRLQANFALSASLRSC